VSSGGNGSFQAVGDRLRRASKSGVLVAGSPAVVGDDVGAEVPVGPSIMRSMVERSGCLIP
jgi:hypothetical protein